MSVSDTIRRPWTEDDKRRLIEYWESLGSILVISLLLNRPEGSVQTEASRLNLPRRVEDKGRHRKKWTDEELNLLDDAVEKCRDPDGRIRIIDVANMTGRSIDAVATRLSREYDDREEFRRAIVIPESVERLKFQPPKPTPPAGQGRGTQIDTRKMTKMRDCLTCRKPFWSEGAHNRICRRCRTEDDASDWD